MDATTYLENLPAQVQVAVNLTTINGVQLKAKGMAMVDDPPTLEIRFPANTLPGQELIDTESDCLIFIETGEIVTLISSIADFSVQDCLLVTVRDVVQHVEKRDFYRGPAVHLSISWTYRSKKRSTDQMKFEASGVNISCGGILMTTDQPLAAREKLMLEIHLPEPVHKTIHCQASVIRVNQVKTALYYTAVQFHGLDSENCDDIMSYCFAEQRRLLREQVVTKDL
ncbi:MAG: PilZ domain-containing protein [Desulfohalobiaceae bacterium]|nr:PilZ domain-containing protein [Desulfohalobiaceae bacterium]